MADNRFDELFISLASQHDSVHGLLRTFFSFLHRKTDFYVVDENQRRPMGFAPGDAERILLSAFRTLPYKGPDGKFLEGQDAGAPSVSSSAAVKPTGSTHRQAPLKDGSTQGATTAQQASAQKLQQTPEHPATRQAQAGSQEPASFADSSRPTSTRSAVSSTTAAPTPTAPRPPTSPYTIIQYTAEGKQITQWYGGVGPGYWWAQTLHDVTLNIALPAGTSAKSIECTVTFGKLKVGLKSASHRILEGPLYAAVRHTEAIWNVESTADTVRRPVDIRPDSARAADGCGAIEVTPADVLEYGREGAGIGHKGCVFTLTLDKVVPTWWLRVLACDPHPSIDGSLVDSTQHVSSYDDDTQAAIRKVMWDQAQKAQGKPTSEELEQARLWDMAKNAPGSPFQPGNGQPDWHQHQKAEGQDGLS